MTRRRHYFTVGHQEKQRILLRALENLPDEDETPAETAAIVAMQRDLERLIRRRHRSRHLEPRKKAGRN